MSRHHVDRMGGEFFEKRFYSTLTRIVIGTLEGLKSQSQRTSKNNWKKSYTDALSKIKNGGKDLFINDIKDHNRRNIHSIPGGIEELYRWAIKRFLNKDVDIAKDFDERIYMPAIMTRVPLSLFYEVMWKNTLETQAIKSGDLDKIDSRLMDNNIYDTFHLILQAFLSWHQMNVMTQASIPVPSKEITHAPILAPTQTQPPQQFTTPPQKQPRVSEDPMGYLDMTRSYMLKSVTPNKKPSSNQSIKDLESESESEDDVSSEESVEPVKKHKKSRRRSKKELQQYSMIDSVQPSSSVQTIKISLSPKKGYTSPTAMDSVYSSSLTESRFNGGRSRRGNRRRRGHGRRQ